MQNSSRSVNVPQSFTINAIASCKLITQMISYGFSRGVCQLHAHPVTGVAASLDQLICWTLIGCRACRSSRWVCACYSRRLWSSGAQHHLWHSHLDVYMASLWIPMFLALFSFIFLHISSSYEQLSAFVEGRWVDHFVLNVWYLVLNDY